MKPDAASARPTSRKLDRYPPPQRRPIRPAHKYKSHHGHALVPANFGESQDLLRRHRTGCN